jgi:hypothetical protein
VEVKKHPGECGKRLYRFIDGEVELLTIQRGSPDEKDKPDRDRKKDYLRRKSGDGSAATDRVGPQGLEGQGRREACCPFYDSVNPGPAVPLRGR